MDQRDIELLAAARAGDPRSVDALLARHQRQLFRFGLRMCGNEDEAREVLQETLLAAFRGLPDFRGDAKLSTWLYQIARSFCLKSRRRGSGQPATTLAIDEPGVSGIPSTEATPDANAHAREMGELLHAAILSLPEKHREVIVLRDVEGLTAEEAAEVLGVEQGALKSRLHRARMDLRQRLLTVMGEEGKPGESRCPELAEELSQYVAEQIDQATCARIEEHLQGCPLCANTCASLRRTVSFCREIPGGEVPAPVRAAVRAALLAATSSQRAPPDRR